jgi:hypothetical protein
MSQFSDKEQESQRDTNNSTILLFAAKSATISDPQIHLA